MSGKVLYQEDTKVVNQTTGEVVENRTNRLVKKTTPEFIMLFTQTSDALRKAALTQAENTLLVHLLTGKYVMSENRVDLTPGARDQLSEESGIARSTVNKIVSQLAKKEIILQYRNRGGTYILNPHIFGKGRFSDLERLRLEVAYDYDFSKLEMTKEETSKSYLKGVTDLKQRPHDVVDVSTNTGDGGEVINEVVVEERSAPVPRDEEPLELLRERNRAKELSIKELELKIKARELGID